jgi:PhoPQ-activated pathogenicity-related protein
MSRSSAVLVSCGAVFLVPAVAFADLPAYVAKADPSFVWQMKGKTDSPLGTVYDLHLVSQVWQGIKWEHGLQVYMPPDVTPTEAMFLFNTGGRPSAENAAFGLSLAAKMKAPVAFLYGIPNQPLFDGKKEDALIAETFVRYLATGDEDWPLLFPMVKSLVRAMDALEAFADEEWNHKVTGFVVSGASKRGWTSWLTAAADPRVKAVAPMVIDTLNFPEQLPHQLKSFGRYSEQIADYTSRGLVPLPDTDAARRLWRMTDPFTFRDKLTVPKFMVLGANDPYWTVDALNNYWDGLRGDKWVCYVPNAGHNLTQSLADGQKDRSRAVDSLAAFARAQLHGLPLPRLQWTHDDADGRPRVTVRATPAPAGARVWLVDAPTRDFRQARWTEQPAAVSGTTISAAVEKPASGYRAFFAELDYTLEGLAYHLSTQVRVVGPAGP